MEAFIRGLFDALPGWAKVLARPIYERVLAVFRWIYGLLTAARDRWLYFAQRVLGWRINLLSFAFWTYLFARWLITRHIPAVINMVMLAVQVRIRQAIAVAMILINLTIAGVKTLVKSWVDRLALVVALGVLALRLLIGRLRSDVDRLLDRIFNLWKTPARLALWLVGAMWDALWKYGYTQLDRISDALWRQRQRIALRTIAEIERIIARLL